MDRPLFENFRLRPFRTEEARAQGFGGLSVKPVARDRDALSFSL